MNTLEYYNYPFIKFQIFPLCKNREVFFKGEDNKIHIRPLAIYSMDGVSFNVNRFFPNRKYHFFASVAKVDFNRFGNPPSDLKDLAGYRKRFHEEFENFVTGYDFVIDIDHEDLKKAHEIAFDIKQIYDKYKLPYYLIFSGKKGFHFRIDWDDIQTELSPFEFKEKTKILAENIANSIGYKFQQDIDSIYDLKRVLRVPYSVHPVTNKIALPLTDAQFEYFQPVNHSLENIFRTVLLKNRGLCKRVFPSSPDFKGFFSSFG